MWWWIKCRRIHSLLPTAFAAFILLIMLMQDRLVVLPSFLTGSANEFLLILMAPVPLCAVLLMSLESRLPSAEDTGLRRTFLLDAGLVLGVVTGAVLSAGLLGTLLDQPSVLSVGRNTAFLTGLMLCLRFWAGQSAVMAPVAWIALVVFFGFENPQQPYPWAILPERSGDPYAAAAAAGMFFIGFSVQLADRRRRHGA